MFAAALRKPWFAWAALTIAWILVVGVGMAQVAIYTQTAGPPAEPPEQWPASSNLSQSADRPTLLLFAHPHCPCTRATLTELAEMLATNTADVRAYVVLYEPRSRDADWPQGGLATTAADIVGVEPFVDQDGVEAERFGVRTSGETLLYDSRGQLRFHGGLTAARGHEGDSPGSAALCDALAGKRPGIATAPVFGCPIRPLGAQTGKETP